MTTLLVTHSACLEHVVPHGHPERPDRLRAIELGLGADRFKPLRRVEAAIGNLDHIALCHSEHYVSELELMAPKEGLAFIDGDTSMSPGTWEAALRCVGGATMAVDAVMKGEVDNAFVCTRPPGHHAEAAKPMGFCFFDNAAIAARYAQRQYGISRAAIVDFDVHHGNGSQDIFWADASVMYCSTHEMPLFPGTGAASERGEHDTIVNAPLRPGDGGSQFRAAFTNVILPQLRKFAPEMIVISAGFDAHWRDPLANIQLQESDYTWVTQQVMELAASSAAGRIVSVLEGGYDLQALKDSVGAHVAALMGT
ncbi:histone deacetylase family protein [Bradyrhizobium sp. WD16]|uniref:histone deacetylase family protein n=1 Tax=Bradyrhizobium sp. WD16 TaxID=1521768 RepID=UPI0020A3F9C7|nr:histone deacetylase family protein [Bradyrhizobium sp. WD16]UTD25603.1 acetoin utilization protein [Bradyrhizobium sp. WD16]